MDKPMRVVLGSAASTASLIAGSVLGYFIDTRASWPSSLVLASSLVALSLLIPGALGLVRFACMAIDLECEAKGEKPPSEEPAGGVNPLRDPVIFGAICASTAIYIASRLLLPRPMHDLVLLLQVAICSMAVFGWTARHALARRLMGTQGNHQAAKAREP
jgi:hypothetical protein